MPVDIGLDRLFFRFLTGALARHTPDFCDERPKLMRARQPAHRWFLTVLFALAGLSLMAWMDAGHSTLFGQEPTSAAPAAGAEPHAGGEANLKLPDLSQVKFRGINGQQL